MKIEDIDSSPISWFESPEEIKRLTVAFRGGGIYVYEDVPIDALKLMRDAPYDDTASVGGRSIASSRGAASNIGDSKRLVS